MNEDMKAAWLEITQMLGEPTKEELDVFLRTWQRAIQAERDACADLCYQLVDNSRETRFATAIRARGNT